MEKFFSDEWLVIENDNREIRDSMRRQFVDEFQFKRSHDFNDIEIKNSDIHRRIKTVFDNLKSNNSDNNIGTIAESAFAEISRLAIGSLQVTSPPPPLRYEDITCFAMRKHFITDILDSYDVSSINRESKS